MKRCVWTAGLAIAAFWAVPCSWAGPLNGSFVNGLTDWTADGNVQAITADGNPMAALEEVFDTGGAQNGFGGRSRLHQTFDLAVSPQWLSFRYRLSAGSGPRAGGVPPDSFTAYLIDPATHVRLLPPSADDAPVFTTGFFYADSDGHMVYDPDYVTVSSEPDIYGMFTVTLDVSSLSGEQSVRAEFGLAETGNEVRSFALLDDIQVDCPAASCCNTTTGEVTPIDDGDPCTQDVCNADGTVDHIDNCVDDCNSDGILDKCQVCGAVSLTFEDVPVGVFITESCTVELETEMSDGSRLVVFDSRHPWGQTYGPDLDLGTPNEGFEIAPGVPGPGISTNGEGGPGSAHPNSRSLGNVLIDCYPPYPVDDDGLVADPNPVPWGTSHRFWFGASGIGPVTILSVDIIDIDNNQTGAFIFLSGSDFFDYYALFADMVTGDNGVRTVQLDVPDVQYMVIGMDGTFASDNIRFLPNADDCLPDVNTDGVADSCQQIPQVARAESAAYYPNDGVWRRISLTEPDGCGSQAVLNVEPRFGGISRLVVTFDMPMDRTTAENAGLVSITGVDNPSPAVTITPVLSVSGLELTLDVSPALPDGDCYTVDLAGMTAGGVKLSPAASTFVVRALEGDSTGDGLTNAVDNSSRKSRFGQVAYPCNLRWDVNLDGAVTAVDNAQTALRFGGTAECE